VWLDGIRITRYSEENKAYREDEEEDGDSKQRSRKQMFKKRLTSEISNLQFSDNQAIHQLTVSIMHNCCISSNNS
jgi:hypothetical protein